MQSDCGRYLHSVSDLYGADEISVLLEEIRELEPANYRPEDLQDFEIAGSQTGGALGGGNDTPGDVGTVRSWDSHANYKHHAPGSSPTHSIFSGVVMYCDETHLKSGTGVIRLLLVISSAACLVCLCSSGTVKVGLFMLPLMGRLRLMMFVTIFSLLVTCLFLFLDISHVVYLFPFNWGKLNAFFYVSASVMYVISSSLVLHLLHTYSETYSWVPKWTRDQLFITTCLGYLCALEALLLSLLTRCDGGQYSPVDEDPSTMTLQERRGEPPRDSPSPTRPPSTPAPPRWPVDDVQPCSSKQSDHYHLGA
uniref:MARVEL domain-containing protein n=1 Tax=Clastoptera arizonana TaxID=38151 RepID=A0A1B6CW01_9HEMI